MCQHCDYKRLLAKGRLEATDKRLRVLEVIGNNSYPLSAADIFQTLGRSAAINRVTVYRILDLLVARGLVDRISTGGRAACYGLAPNPHHPRHPHFYCKRCGRMECLNPGSLELSGDSLWKTFPGRIDRVEVLLDGICKNCLRSSPST